MVGSSSENRFLSERMFHPTTFAKSIPSPESGIFRTWETGYGPDMRPCDRVLRWDRRRYDGRPLADVLIIGGGNAACVRRWRPVKRALM
jgi:hypothetical protein